jgi:hypothetical protein
VTHRIVAIVAASALGLAACATPLTPRESGTLAGAGIGAATGAILGGIGGAPGKGAAIGAAVGAVTGALTGNAIQTEQAARAHTYGAPAGPPHSRYGPHPPPNAALQIEATPGTVEILVDGRSMGLARDYTGAAVVPVIAGPHTVEFRWAGFSVATHVMVPYGTTVAVRRELAPPATAPDHGHRDGGAAGRQS